MDSIGESLLNFCSKIPENDVGDTQLEITCPDEANDRPDEGYDDEGEEADADNPDEVNAQPGIAESLPNVDSKILKDEFGDTQQEITMPDEVNALPGIAKSLLNFGSKILKNDVGDTQQEIPDPKADADNQGPNEKGTVDGDDQPSNATDNNKDSTENPTEPNGEGGSASSAAKETEKEQQLQAQPETETQAKSTPSEQEKAPCPSNAVPFPTPEDDAATLYRAFKGKGCDMGKVVQILAQRDSTHRNQIAQLYKRNYKEELSDRISSEFSRIGLLGDLTEQVGVDLTVNPTGSFSLLCSDIKRAITLWLLNESERDATIVWQSLQVTSLDKAAVTEVICSRTPTQLRSLKQAYFTKYGSRLLEDISASTFRFNGYHKELLIACLDDKTARDEGANVDPKMAEEDAKQLYKDGENMWGTNEKTFIEIFTKRNRPHLAAVDVAYEKLYGHSLEEVVKKETSGSFEDGLVTLLRCAKNSAKYFAEVLYNSMKGLGTSNAILLRTVVTKAGSIEMEYIKKEYSAAYNMSLMDAIHKDTSGHYRTFLLNLVE